MPQPMSTPTAAGMIAPLVGITLPTVAPMPQWTSGIAAIHLKMNGSCAAFRSCLRAASSRETPFVHALTGTPLSGAITLYVVSDISISSYSGKQRRQTVEETLLYPLSYCPVIVV